MRKRGGDIMFQVGDNIFYPMHGAGKIEAIEEKEISGELVDYYIIKMSIGNMNVMIPKGKISNFNIRPVMDLAAIKKFATRFKRGKSNADLTWKLRHKENMDKIKSGKLEDSADVVCGLLHMQKEDKLNASEKKVLDQARQFLLSELNLVEGMTEKLTGKFLSKLMEDTVPAS